MKLIDADLLADEVNKEYREQKQLYEEIGYKERFGIVRGLGKASEIIAKQPIVDAAPVVHARWISKHDGDPGECSNCHDFWDVEFDNGEHYGRWLTFPSYCPNCGAKMDGGESDNE